MTDPGPILGDTSSQDAAVSPLERFSIFDVELLHLFKVFSLNLFLKGFQSMMLSYCLSLKFLNFFLNSLSLFKVF
jgi:hypothetical protein